MTASRKLFSFVLFVTLAFSAFLSGCSPTATPTSAPADQATAPAAEPTAEPVEPTTAPAAETPTEAPTAAPAAETPVDGGTLVLASTNEPDTLDIQKSSYGITSWITQAFGGTLLSKDVNGKYIPYLAASWSASEDGLTWTFKLKPEVKFHNGDPLKAQDWVYTINRAKDPATKSPVSKGMVDPISKAEAVDDYTLQLTLAEPFYPILDNLTSEYLMPYDQKAVEAAGDTYGQNPVGAGPYKFKEWVTDEKVVLEVNKDFTWGPIQYEGANPGPYHIQTMEWRVMPEYATIVAGLQAGEIDQAGIQAKDLQTIKDTENFQIFEGISSSTFHVLLNNSKAPFDNVKVRQAFSMATDRQAIIKIVTNGTGIELHGPISPAVIGYDPNVEQAGPKYDLEAAKALIQEAGYTYDANGKLLTPDGKPFTLVLKTPTIESYVKTAQILKDQWGSFGVDVTLEQYEWGTLSPQYVDGDFLAGTLEIGWPEADILYLWFHSSQIGALNWPRTTIPELDTLLATTRTLTDAAERQAAVNEAQKVIAEQSYIIPIFAFKAFSPLSNKVVGAQYSDFTGILYPDAYIKQ